MNIVPAIDLIDGESVRLQQGDYDLKKRMQRTPQEALALYEQYPQVTRVHLVDLIGAKAQKTIEADFIGELKKLTHLPFEIGGGLRSLESIQAYDAMGIDYFILGTRAIVDIPWLTEIVALYPGRIYVGIDARGEDIYINGWTQASGRQIDEYVHEIEPLEIAGIIYTDIAKDGMEEGPNITRTAALQRITRHTVVASGGVRHQADLTALQAAGIQEAIVGKAANTETFWKGLVK